MKSVCFSVSLPKHYHMNYNTAGKTNHLCFLNTLSFLTNSYIWLHYLLSSPTLFPWCAEILSSNKPLPLNLAWPTLMESSEQFCTASVYSLFISSIYTISDDLFDYVFRQFKSSLCRGKLTLVSFKVQATALSTSMLISFV